MKGIRWIVKRNDEAKTDKSRKMEEYENLALGEKSSASTKNPHSIDDTVVGILRIETVLIDNMLGNGALLQQENFFPNTMHDEGYDFLTGLQKNGVLAANTLVDYK